MEYNHNIEEKCTTCGANPSTVFLMFYIIYYTMENKYDKEFLEQLTCNKQIQIDYWLKAFAEYKSEYWNPNLRYSIEYIYPRCFNRLMNNIKNYAKRYTVKLEKYEWINDFEKKKKELEQIEKFLEENKIDKDKAQLNFQQWLYQCDIYDMSSTDISDIISSMIDWKQMCNWKSLPENKWFLFIFDLIQYYIYTTLDEEHKAQFKKCIDCNRQMFNISMVKQLIEWATPEEIVNQIVAQYRYHYSWRIGTCLLDLIYTTSRESGTEDFLQDEEKIKAIKNKNI